MILFSFSEVYLYSQTYLAPESVVYDAKRNCYYISNVGHITNPDGTIIKRDSLGNLSYLTTDLLLDPRGIVIVDDTLYVADRYKISYYDLEKNIKIGSILLGDMMISLNDITCDDQGYLYVTEMNNDRVYRINTKNKSDVQNINFQGELINAFGLLFDKANNRLLFVSHFENAKIYSMDLETMIVSVAKSTMYDYFEGITTDKEGNIYVSVWSNTPSTPQSGYIVKFKPDLSDEGEVIVENLDGPTDIFMDTINNVLCVPNLGTSKVDFIKLNTTVEPPILKYPFNNMTGLGRNIEFRWEEVESAQSYTIQLSKFENFESILMSFNTTSTTHNLTGLDKNTKFYWRARAISTQFGTDWSEVWNFTTSDVEYAPPTLISPENGEMYASRTPRFVWSKSNAGLYNFQLWTNNTASGLPVTEIKNLSDTAFNFTTPLDLNTTYYWRVNTFSGYITSDWSEWSSFRVANFSYPTPVLLLPYDKSTEQPLSPKFVWKSNPAGNYRFQISPNANFQGSIVYDISQLVDTFLVLPIELNKGEKFYWRVYAYKDDVGSWSAAFSFTTSTNSSVDDISELIEIYPNPSSDVLFVSTENIDINALEISSLDGKLLLTINDLIDNKASISLKDLPNGTYNVRIYSGDNVIVKRFIVKR